MDFTIHVLQHGYMQRRLNSSWEPAPHDQVEQRCGRRAVDLNGHGLHERVQCRLRSDASSLLAPPQLRQLSYVQITDDITNTAVLALDLQVQSNRIMTGSDQLFTRRRALQRQVPSRICMAYLNVRQRCLLTLAAAGAVTEGGEVKGLPHAELR